VAPYAFPAPGPAAARRAARRRLPATIALGASLAPQGTMVKIALVVAAATVLGGVATAIVLSARGGGATGALGQLGAATSTLLAWGAGILIAVPASLHAFHDDRRNGIRALLRARGASTATYARGRVLGLAVVLLAVVGGGTLASGGAAVLLASRAGVAARALGELVASLTYAAAFAIVVSPMALAAFGTRSAGRGYLRFFAVLLVLPELLKPWTSELVPRGWGELLSVPSALSALRAAALPQAFDLARFARAGFVLAAFGALCFAYMLAELVALDAVPDGESARGESPVRIASGASQV
jgi:hypothetical protein